MVSFDRCRLLRRTGFASPEKATNGLFPARPQKSCGGVGRWISRRVAPEGGARPSGKRTRLNSVVFAPSIQPERFRLASQGLRQKSGKDWHSGVACTTWRGPSMSAAAAARLSGLPPKRADLWSTLLTPGAQAAKGRFALNLP